MGNTRVLLDKNGERDYSMNYGRIGKEEPEYWGPVVVNAEFHEWDGKIVDYDDECWHCPATDEGKVCQACSLGLGNCIGGYPVAYVLLFENGLQAMEIPYDDLRALTEEEEALMLLAELDE